MVSDSRILVVTVGKSLFSSASWRSEAPFDFRSYRRWCEGRDENGKLLWLRNPELRAKDDDTGQKISKILKDFGENDPVALARLVTLGESDEPRRSGPKGRQHRAWGVSPRKEAPQGSEALKGQQQTLAGGLLPPFQGLKTGLDLRPGADAPGSMLPALRAFQTVDISEAESVVRKR